MSNKSRTKQSRSSRPTAKAALTLPMADASGAKSGRGFAAGGDQLFMPMQWTRQVWIGCLALAVVFVAAYWIVLKELVATWEREPDYSHGYLVVPIACYMLYARRVQAPSAGQRLAWLGLGLVIVAFAIRVAGSLWYVDAVQAWSIPIWIAGAIWFFGGWGLFRWSLPAVAFLAFAIPLPYRGERLLSGPLQTIAARFSCAILQTIGLPTVREGNVVIVNDFPMEIAEACSGMRIFISVVALAFAYTVLVDRPWWTKACLWLSVVPIALLVNASRITFTAILDLFVLGVESHEFNDQLSGFVAIGFASLLMAGVIWYMGRLIVRVQSATPSEALWGSPIGQAT